MILKEKTHKQEKDEQETDINSDELSPNKSADEVMIVKENSPEREIETVMSNTSDQENNFGCVRLLKKHLRPPGLCRFRDEGCTRLDCKFAHRLPDHLSLPTYCKDYLEGLCEDDSYERNGCLSLHHCSYQYLNQIYLQKRQQLVDSCDQCFRKVFVKIVNDLDANNISNVDNTSVLAERVSLSQKKSLYPYESQEYTDNITKKSLSFKRKASVHDRLGHEFCSTRGSIGSEEDNDEEVRLYTEDFSMFEEDTNSETDTDSKPEDLFSWKQRPSVHERLGHETWSTRASTSSGKDKTEESKVFMKIQLTKELTELVLMQPQQSILLNQFFKTYQQHFRKNLFMCEYGYERGQLECLIRSLKLFKITSENLVKTISLKNKMHQDLGKICRNYKTYGFCRFGRQCYFFH